MFSFRSMTVAACVCVAASLATHTLDGVAGEKTESPKITFKKGDVAKALTKCPGGNVQIELSGKGAQLSDAKTGKPIGVALKHDGSDEFGDQGIITRWAFSPDGKLIATGSRSSNKEASAGQICVWDVGTGERVAEYGSYKKEWIGDVAGLAFGEDGKTVLFQAGACEPDGK